jgi:hypothetical protein
MDQLQNYLINYVGTKVNCLYLYFHHTRWYLNQDNVFEWTDMSTCELLFQWASFTKIQFSVYKADVIIISLTLSLFSPWYSWKNAELALNNNHSLWFIELNLPASITPHERFFFPFIIFLYLLIYFIFLGYVGLLLFIILLISKLDWYEHTTPSEAKLQVLSNILLYQGILVSNIRQLLYSRPHPCGKLWFNSQYSNLKIINGKKKRSWGVIDAGRFNSIYHIVPLPPTPPDNAIGI